MTSSLCADCAVPLDGGEVLGLIHNFQQMLQRAGFSIANLAVNTEDDGGTSLSLKVSRARAPEEKTERKPRGKRAASSSSAEVPPKRIATQPCRVCASVCSVSACGVPCVHMGVETSSLHNHKVRERSPRSSGTPDCIQHGHVRTGENDRATPPLTSGGAACPPQEHSLPAEAPAALLEFTSGGYPRHQSAGPAIRQSVQRPHAANLDTPRSAPAQHREEVPGELYDVAHGVMSSRAPWRADGHDAPARAPEQTLRFGQNVLHSHGARALAVPVGRARAVPVGRNAFDVSGRRGQPSSDGARGVGRSGHAQSDDGESRGIETEDGRQRSGGNEIDSHLVGEPCADPPRSYGPEGDACNPERRGVEKDDITTDPGRVHCTHLQSVPGHELDWNQHGATIQRGGTPSERRPSQQAVGRALPHPSRDAEGSEAVLTGEGHRKKSHARGADANVKERPPVPRTGRGGGASRNVGQPANSSRHRESCRHQAPVGKEVRGIASGVRISASEQRPPPGGGAESGGVVQAAGQRARNVSGDVHGVGDYGMQSHRRSVLQQGGNGAEGAAHARNESNAAVEKYLPPLQSMLDRQRSAEKYAVEGTGTDGTRSAPPPPEAAVGRICRVSDVGSGTGNAENRSGDTTEVPAGGAPASDRVESVPCGFCDTSLPSEAARTLHVVDTHKRDVEMNAEGRVVCFVNGCSGTYAKRFALWRHVRTVHLAQKDHKCESCGHEFGDVSTLQQHRDGVHLKKKPWSCSQCESTFTQSSSLGKHVRQKHGGAARGPSPNE